MLQLGAVYVSLSRGRLSDLCNALSAVARNLCTTFVDPGGLSAFVSCRLIALDKCPGVRPIGVGETVRRVIARQFYLFLRGIFERLLVHRSFVPVSCLDVRQLFILYRHCLTRQKPRLLCW